MAVSASHQAAANLPRLRGFHRVTQTELGDLLGLCRSAIAKVESGQRRLTLDEAHIVARTFNISVDQLCSPLRQISATDG